LALDEPKDTDGVYETGGFKFLLDKELAQQTGEIKIDMTYYGFSVDAQNPMGGGSCSSCSTGSCSC
jgi:hypothetical protein